MPIRFRRSSITIAVLLLASFPAWGGARDMRWVSGQGEWGDASRWSGGPPDVMSRAAIHEDSVVRLSSALRVGVAGMRLGTLSSDKVRLLIAGQLVARRDFIQVGEAGGGEVEIVLGDRDADNSSALHCVSACYLGGAGNERLGACRATLRIRSGSFVSRLATLGWGHGAEATLAVEGSRASAVHLLDYLTMGVPGKEGEPSTSTLAFTLDERGVTPITIQSRRTGLSIVRQVPTNRCRLQVTLSAVPPQDDVTLVAAHVATKGAFDDLPEGSEISAEHAGRTYRWKLTYRGGRSGCDVVLTQVRGHAESASVTKCRSRPAVPRPLWESMPARNDTDAADAPVAFEGAEGFGRLAAGGRGGPTLWVENLNDDGPGSFRAAARAKGPRTIAFRVSGTIQLKSPLQIVEPFVTVDGESSPDNGIAFEGNGFLVQTHDVVLRHFRIRPGDDTHDTDALSFYDAERCIADHLSVSWATDEVLSVTGLSDAITVQWCVISEGLNRDQHGYASIAAGERVTWHHNLFAHHISRVPRFAGIVQADFRNNVLYNWGHTAGYGQFERVNYVGNYLKPGLSTTNRPPRIHQGDETVGNGSLFLEGNILHGDEARTRDNWLAVGFDREVRAAQPFAAPPVRTSPADEAITAVLTHAGALPTRRDRTDTRIAREVREGTGRVINKVADVVP